MYDYQEIHLTTGESYTLKKSDNVVGAGLEDGDVKREDGSIIERNTYIDLTSESLTVEAVSDCFLTLVILIENSTV